MKKIGNRFHIEKRSKIYNEYVVYTEDLVVSFTDTKNHNKKKTILNGVNFNIKKGETISLIGANGAGKTVLTETILGINKIESGKIYLNLGRDTYRENLMEIGMQFQQSKFPKGQKVSQIINTYKTLYKKRVIPEELEEMINIFGINEFYDQQLDEISGGQKQRVNLLLSLMHNPKLMILDEFITGLDVKMVRQIITHVNKMKLKNGSSMIIISHQPEEIESLSDRVFVLNNGKITKETTVPEILKEYGHMDIFIEENI